jgi:hypothetical protein
MPGWRTRSPGVDGSRLISDAEVFHRTTHPVAFEPDARLARLARRHECVLADRNNLLKAVDATGLSLPPSSDGDDRSGTSTPPRKPGRDAGDRTPDILGGASGTLRQSAWRFWAATGACMKRVPEGAVPLSTAASTEGSSDDRVCS